MKGKIANWTAGRMSLAGRVTLAQSVLSTMPLYAMQTTKIPIGTCEDMERVVRDFVWGKTEDKNRMSMVSWEALTCPKEEGGLGLRELHLVNKAFGMKVCWEMFNNKNSLWGSILCSKYKFDPHTGFDPIAPSVCTPLWRLVCNTWPDMWRNVSWAIGSGRKVMFWIHRWVPNMKSPLSEVAVSSIPDHLMYKTVDFFVDSSGWAWDRFERLIPAEVANIIAATAPPSAMEEDDIAFWGPSSTGDFTVKTAYDSLARAQTSTSFLPWTRIWNWYGPQRIKTFFWLLLKNGVLVNEERMRRHIATNAACGMCGMHTESRLHMLRDCLDARRTWEGLLKFCNLEWFFDPSIHLNDWIIRNVSSKLQVGSGMKWCTIFGVGCWNIWKKRCGFVLNNERLSPETVLSQTIIMAKSVEDARMTAIVCERMPRPPVTVSWQPPSSTILKLNTDASLERGTGRAYGGGLLRDYLGQWRQGFVTNIGVCSILLAEIWCIFHGLEIAKALGIRLLEVESDNLVAVAMITGKFEVNVSCRAIVRKIGNLLLEFDSASVRHVHREGNFAADFLSHHAYKFERGVHILEQPPTDLGIWLLHDRIGISYNR